MKHIRKHFVALFLALVLLCCGALAEASVQTNAVEIQKYGNLILEISGTDFLAAGFAAGDVITVSFGDTALEMPVGTNYSDVDNGSLVCRVIVNAETGEDAVVLAVNMGNLAEAAGIAQKASIEEEPGYRWDYQMDWPLPMTIAMKEQGGYEAEYLLRQLTRTNAREDYLHLSDEEFANFRAVSTTGMGEKKLYRSSSPVNPELGRNTFADAALKAAGVRTVINLADSEAAVQAYEGYGESAYAQCSIIGLNLGVDPHTADFQQGLAKGLRFMLANEGPYLVHCTEGKDRAGFVSALLECLMGASADEVAADYMTTYMNYYGVEPGSEQYQAIENSNIRKTLAAAFGLPELTADTDLAAEAAQYLQESLGLSEQEVAALKEKLQ